jgi:hypothetical protein
VSWNEESLLSEMVHHYQDSSKTFGAGELLDEILEIDFQGQNGTGS